MVSLSFHNYHQYSWIIIRIHLHICHHPPSIFVDLPMFPLICFRPGPVSVCPGEHVKHVKFVKPQSSCLVNGSKWKQDRNILPNFANVLQMSHVFGTIPPWRAQVRRPSSTSVQIPWQCWQRRFGDLETRKFHCSDKFHHDYHDSIMIHASSHLFFHFWYNLMLQDLLYTWL